MIMTYIYTRIYYMFLGIQCVYMLSLVYSLVGKGDSGKRGRGKEREGKREREDGKHHWEISIS